MVSSLATGSERRRARRYPAAELRATVRLKKGLLSESWEEVGASDFSRQGIAIETGASLQIGDALPLSLSLHMEVGTIHVERITGVVRHKKILGQQVRYGLEFDLSQRVKGSDLESQLARIEGLLERSQNLAQRILDQSKR